MTLIILLMNKNLTKPASRDDYEKPACNVVGICVEQILCASMETNSLEKYSEFEIGLDN